LSSLPSPYDVWDERCRRDPLYWAQKWTLTENPKYIQQGLAFKNPFPKKSYFVPLFETLMRSRRLLIPKSREMITSWSVMAYGTNRGQFKKAFVVVQTEAEGKVVDLLRYCRILYENQPDWMKPRHPLASEPSQTELRWKDGGRILGIPKGEHKIRLYHPTIYVMDEAAFLPEAQQCYDAAHPVAEQIIAISSAGPGWFGDQCSR